jgi:hypothetical protein
MNRAVLFLMLLLVTFVPAEPAPVEYNLDVHVTSSYFVFGGGGVSQWLNVVIGGKKYQLFDSYNGYLLAWAITKPS